MIQQTPPRFMSKEERNDEVALYMQRACLRLIVKKKKAKFEGSLFDYLKNIQKPKRKRVQYKIGISRLKTSCKDRCDSFECTGFDEKGLGIETNNWRQS